MRLEKKTNTVEEYRKAVQNIHDAGMIVIGCFVFGFDTDTKEVFDDTLAMIKNLKIDIVDFLVFTPFPGTPLFNELEKENRILTKKWSRYNMKNVVFKPRNMTPQELLRGIRNMYNEFYSPPYILRRILNCLKLGFYPLFLMLERNISARMQMRLLKYSK